MKQGKEIILLAQRIRALSETALVFSTNDYEIERSNELIDISNRLTTLATGIKEEELQALFIPKKEYVTPKVDIRAVVFNEANEILLVQEKSDGRWAMPGGWADVGFSPKEMAERETREETGLEVRAERLLAVMDKQRHEHPLSPFYLYKLFILCHVTGGTFTKAFDILDCGFFPLDRLPPLSLHRILPEQIRLMERLRHLPGELPYCD